MRTYDVLTQQNARKTLQRLTGIAWSTWQCLNKNYNREQFLSDEDYVNSILDKEGCLLPAFRDLEFIFGHITTSSTACESIRNGGLTKLACTNKGTELGLFLSNHGVDIMEECMTSALVIAHQNITEKNMPHGVLDESCITIIASVDSFLIVSSHMEAIFIKDRKS